MTQKNVEEQTPNTEEQTPLATASASGAEGGDLSQRHSGSDQDLKVQLDAALEEIKKTQAELRGLQSKQDKAETKIEKYFQELGIELNPEQRSRYETMRLQEKIADLEQRLTSSPPEPQARKADESVDEVLRKAGIANPTEDDRRLYYEFRGDPVVLGVQLAQRQMNKPTPSPANIASPNKTGVSVDINSLQDQINDVLASPAGRTKEGLAKVKELRKEMEKLEG